MCYFQRQEDTGDDTDIEKTDTEDVSLRFYMKGYFFVLFSF